MANDTNNARGDQTSAGSKPVELVTPVMTKEDIEKNKIWAVIAYFGIIGVVIVLVTEAKNSPFAKFHLNQSFPLAIASLAGSTILGMIPIIGWSLIPLLNIAVLVLIIMGIINAAQGEAKRLPIVGNFDVIK